MKMFKKKSKSPMRQELSNQQSSPSAQTKSKKPSRQNAPSDDEEMQGLMQRFKETQFFKKDESSDETDSDYENKMRESFIHKVYIILSVQTLLTCLAVSVCFHYRDKKTLKEVMNNFTTVIVVSISFFVSTLALICCNIHSFIPVNFILLAIQMVSEAWLVSCICLGVSHPMIVVEASVLSLGAIVAITIFALFTKWDFNILGTGLFVFMVVLSFAGFFIFSYGYSIRLLIATVVVIFLSFIMIYDTQMIIDGRHRLVKKSQENYVLAAVSLQLDVLFFFLILLDLFEKQDKDE